MSKPKMRMAIVEWVDSAAAGRWRDIDEYRKLKPASCVSVGFVIHRSKDRVVLLQSIDNDNQNGSDSMSIPAKCVTRFRLLKEK